MFKDLATGLIYENRKDAVIVMGTTRYRKALKERRFIFNYQLQPGEQPVRVESNRVDEA